MLSVGSRLGPYEILALLGEGGMGQVFRATDTKLKRQVAIKILPPSLAADRDRLARFQREAEVLASLNHPNIAAIYGLETGQVGQVGRDDGTPGLVPPAQPAPPAVPAFIVMELVEGEDLSQRIVKGAIPIEEALPIAIQIADALEAAHEKGVVHRDLKPANIKLRADGTVKVLDFGLAKAMDQGAGGAGGEGLTQSPTITTPAMTAAGMILGTAAYMSPEQARGRTVDTRADIWAFGVVLYEMLTGRRAFGGDEVTDTLAAVVLREPDWSALPVATPPGIRRLLARCLRKDQKERLHHVADVRLELNEPGTDEARASSESSTGAPSRLQLAAGAAVVLALAGAAAFQTLRLARGGGGTPSLVRFSVPPPAGIGVGDSGGPLAVVSPDGSRLVLVYKRGTTQQLFIRRLDEDEAKPIAGTEGATRPFFSPDGKWVAYSSNRNRLKKVALESGAVVDIGEAVSSFGSGTWLPDDTIVFTPHAFSGLWRVAAAGGTPQKLTEPDTAAGELGHFWPQVLPDGKTILFTSFRTPAERSRIEVYSPDTGARKVVVDGGFHGRYAASGHVLFARSTTLFAQTFNLSRQEAIGTAVPVLSGVAVSLPDGLAQFSVSPAGTLAFVSQAALNAPRRLAWLDSTGRASPAGDARRRFEDPALSPDGSRIAVTIRDENDADVWVYDLARGTFSRVTSSPTTQGHPVWTPDGRRLFFLFEEPVFHVYSRAVDGAAQPERVIDAPFDVIPYSVSPDGQFLVYTRADPSTRGGIWLQPLKGDGKPRVLVDTPFKEDGGAVSPDGRWLAYVSDETGRNEVYIQSFPETAERVQVSTNGGDEARWSRDGKAIFFREADKLMTASVHGREVGRPAMLFEKQWLGYDVAADGRFIAVLPDENTPPAPVHVVLNWTEELKQRVPTVSTSR